MLTAQLAFTPADFEDLATHDIEGLLYLLLLRMLPPRPDSSFQPTRYELVLDTGVLVTVEPTTKGAT